MPALNKTYTKAAELPGGSLTASQNMENVLNRMYQLTYFRGGGGDNMIFLIMNREVTIGEAVAVAKEYCKTNEFRFKYLQPAVVNLNVEEIIE